MNSNSHAPIGVSIGVLILAAAFAAPAVALPRVILREDCPLVQTYQTTAEALVAFVADSGEGLPADYTVADLEAGTGDGAPDYYQLMLLAAALCSGDPGLNQTFAANRAATADYLSVVDDLVEWAVSAHAHAATASEELELFMAWPLYGSFVPESIQAYVTLFAGGLATLLEATEFLADTNGELDALLDQLQDLTDIIAGAAGLSTEMRATFQAIVEQLLADVFAYQSEISAMADTLDLAANMLGLITFYERNDELKAALLDVAGDLRAADDLIDRLHFPAIALYGADKADGEPFSGLGDYDVDGTTNADVYAIISSRGGDVAQFVKAASGADPFYLSDNVPAAGTIGLAVLGAIIAVAGAFILFRKPRA